MHFVSRDSEFGTVAAFASLVMEETGIRWQSLECKEEKQARRESFGKGSERKLNQKPEMSIEKCKEEIAFFNAQTEKFFVEERGLLSGLINPKVACEVAFIIKVDVEELFGKCTKFCTTNSSLKPNARKDLMDLYAKIYGSTSVTNNEFASWLVKGYIAQLKKKNVNWALAASMTACEKAERAHRLLLRLQSSESSDDGTASKLKQSSCTSLRDGFGRCSVEASVKVEGAQVRPENSLSGLGFKSICSYFVSSRDLDVVRDLTQFESEILGIAMSKVRFIENECKKIGDKLVGFKFSMDDRRITTKEDEEKVLQLQSQFERATKAIVELELQAASISIGGAEGTEGADHDQLKENLAILQSDNLSLERKLDVARSVAESSRHRAMKGEDLYQDIKDEQVRAESDLEILKKETMDMKRYATDVEEQCVQMEKGSGLSLWPKPALHLVVAKDFYVNPPTLVLHPCVFCNRGYPNYDIVIASCKHIYHIFCAAAVAKMNNQCTRCDEVFHPHWWQNFGFPGAYPSLEDEILRLELLAYVEELKQSLKETGTHHVVDYEILCARTQSSMKVFDWGSSGSMPRTIDPHSGRQSIATSSVHRLPSLASGTLSEEPSSQDLGLAISNSRGQEVESPVKNHRIQLQPIDHTDDSLNAVGTEAFLEVEAVGTKVFMAVEGDLSQQFNNWSESEVSNISKRRNSLLKRPGDLLEEYGDGKKKIALTALLEKNVELQFELHIEVASNEEETGEGRALSSIVDKGKGKAKCSRKKTRESQASDLGTGRVCTRSDSKRK